MLKIFIPFLLSLFLISFSIQADEVELGYFCTSQDLNYGVPLVTVIVNQSNTIEYLQNEIEVDEVLSIREIGAEGFISYDCEKEETSPIGVYTVTYFCHNEKINSTAALQVTIENRMGKLSFNGRNWPMDMNCQRGVPENESNSVFRSIN